MDRLHALLQQHGPELLRGAFDHAVAAETFGAEYVAHYLRRAQTPASVTTIPEAAELPL